MIVAVVAAGSTSHDSTEVNVLGAEGGAHHTVYEGREVDHVDDAGRGD